MVDDWHVSQKIARVCVLPCLFLFVSLVSPHKMEDRPTESVVLVRENAVQTAESESYCIVIVVWQEQFA